MHNKNHYKILFLFLFILYIFLLGKYVLVPSLNTGKSVSPELKVHSVSNFSNFKTKAVAASCGYIPHGGEDEFSACTTQINCSGTMIDKVGTSQCGGICQPNNQICPYYIPNILYQNPAQIINSEYIYTNNTAPTPSYTLSNSTATTVCEIQRSSSDGTISESRTELYTNKTIWSGQTPKQYPYFELLKVRCASDVTKLSNVSFTEKKAKIAYPQWGQPCISLPNVCNQTATGTYDENGICNANPPGNPSACSVTNSCGQVYNGYNCSTGCTATLGVEDLNASCITEFIINPNTTIPNGYVDLLWHFGTLNNVNANCSIYNVNNPRNPLPISGLQNLNINTVNGRISNIQENMNVQLSCSFTNPSTGVSFGQIIKNQIIKLFRVQEN